MTELERIPQLIAEDTLPPSLTQPPKGEDNGTGTAAEEDISNP